MRKWDTVAIIGVGLIGGSIGLALQQRRLAKRVIGIGRRTSSLERAREQGAVSSATTDLASGVARAELVIVCTPIEQIVGHVEQVAEHCPEGSLITDVGSTKANIVAALAQQQERWRTGITFIGSHPLAGSQRTGADFARGDLLEDRVVIITPTAQTPSAQQVRLKSFWETLGAQVVQQVPEDHDRLVACISHVPHVVAAALAACTPPATLPLTASGWMDTTRIAAGDVELWRQILLDNRAHVLRALESFEKVLADLRQALSTGDSAQLTTLLEAGKRNRDAVGN